MCLYLYTLVQPQQLQSAVITGSPLGINLLCSTVVQGFTQNFNIFNIILHIQSTVFPMVNVEQKCVRI